MGTRYTKGAYSPSNDEYFDKVQQVDLDSLEAFKFVPNTLSLTWKEGDTDIQENGWPAVEDRLYFGIGTNVEYHTILPYGSNDPWLNHGGISITIRGEGEITGIANFPLGYRINGEIVASNITTPMYESQGMEACTATHHEVIPHIADPNNYLDPGFYFHTLDPTRWNSGDSAEFFYNTTGRNCWDKLSIGMACYNTSPQIGSAKYHDVGYISFKNITCKSVIVIETLHRHGHPSEPALVDRFQKLYIGNKTFDNFGMPFDTLYNGESEKNGDGYYSFAYIHPKTNQVIVNDFTKWGINEVPKDLMFFDNEMETCPLVPPNPWYDSSCTIPICANMHECYLPPEPTLDPALRQQAFEYWNHDIAIAKTGVKIPPDAAFTVNNAKIWVGYWDPSKELLKLQESKNETEDDFYVLTEDNYRILL